MRNLAWLAALTLTGCLFGGKGDDVDGDGTTGSVTGSVTGAATGAGSWSEADWCASLGDLSAIEADHSAANLRASLVGISEIRYPPAVEFIEAQSDSELNLWMFGGADNFDSVLDAYEVAVHEGCHIWGFGSFSFDSYSYRVVDDTLIIETAYLDNFDRSEIMDRHPYPTDDFYSDVYLTGSSGAQGFNTLLDEYNAYTHSLASRYCTRDTIAGSTSARDGILTMMLYVELYLQIAREDHPDDYDEILADADTVELILTIWDRAEYWLEVTANSPELGIDDDKIEGFVYDPQYLGEIDRLR